LNPEERARLALLERAGVLKATLAGALSAAASVVAATSAGSEEQSVQYWSLVLGVTAVASLLELGYLYWDGVGTVRRMANAAGLELNDAVVSESIALGLARAALELPSPPESSLGVHAHQERSKLVIVGASLLYKAKVTITNLVLKLLLRRVLGRAAGAYVAVVAIPVTAVWNGIVAFRILREARLRIVGSTSTDVLLDFIGADGSDCVLAMKAIACVTVSAARVHPNVEALAERLLHQHPEIEVSPALGDRRKLLAELVTLTPSQRAIVLRAAVAASVIDARLSKREEKLLSELAAAAKRELPLAELRELTRNLVFGSGLDEERLGLLHKQMS
jgi:hypothetical protein